GRPPPDPGVRRGRPAVLERVGGTLATHDLGGRLVRAVRDEVGTRTGARERFAAVFRERYRDLYGLAYRLLGGHGEGEDVVQEAFLQVDGGGGLGRAGDRPSERAGSCRRRVCLTTAYTRLRAQRRASDRLDRAGRAERADDETDTAATPLLDGLRAQPRRAGRQALR